MLGLFQKMGHLLEALTARFKKADLWGRRPVGGPSASVSSRSTVRMRSPTFRWSEARLRAWSAARSCLLGGRRAANEMKYRATELYREAGLRGDLGENSSQRGCGGGRACCWRGQAAGGGYAGCHGEGRLGSVASSVESPTYLLATRMVDMACRPVLSVTSRSRRRSPCSKWS